MKPIKQIKTSNIVAGIAILLCVAAAWAMFALNAFASEDINPVAADPAPAADPEALEESTSVAEPEVATDPTPANDKVNVWFDFVGLKQGVVPEVMLVKDRKPVYDYKVGDPISVENGALLTKTVSEYSSEGSVELNATASDWYTFCAYTPIGYKLDSITPDVPKLEGETHFKFNYSEYTGNYTINLEVRSGKTILSGVDVIFYDTQWNFVDQKTTDASGKCTFELPAAKARGIIECDHEGYLDNMEMVEPQNYKPETHTIERTLRLQPEEGANLKMTSDDKNHDYFEFKSTLVSATDPSIILQDITIKKQSIKTRAGDINGEFIVGDDGILLHEEADSEMHQIISIKPLGKDGSCFDHWDIALTKTGEAKEYRKGDKFNFDSVNNVLFGKVSYKNGEGPEPTPTPTEEVTAQTGDSAPLVPFVLLAVLAGGVLLYTRKASQK